jgi:hypothetical protein
MLLYRVIDLLSKLELLPLGLNSAPGDVSEERGREVKDLRFVSSVLTVFLSPAIFFFFSASLFSICTTSAYASVSRGRSFLSLKSSGTSALLSSASLTLAID